MDDSHTVGKKEDAGKARLSRSTDKYAQIAHKVLKQSSDEKSLSRSV